MRTIAERAKSAVVTSGRTQSSIAALIDMKPDALSRALSGDRGFGALELASLAHALRVDLHDLITGEPDPSRLLVSARHSFNKDTGERTVESRDTDKAAIEAVRLAYQQASPVPETPSLPATASAMRDALGDGFVRDFADRVEGLGIDVIRIEGLGTAWSAKLFKRAIITVPMHPNWFRQNWDIAHELAHLALGHEGTDPSSPNSSGELAANAFAAELLAPEAEVKDLASNKAELSTFANYVWNSGISTSVLRNRLDKIGITMPAPVYEMLDGTTQSALRRHAKLHRGRYGHDPITTRMSDANTRRFPTWLLNAHTDAVANGSVNKDTLAWMLGTVPAELEVEEPDRGREPSDAELLEMLS